MAMLRLLRSSGGSALALSPRCSSVQSLRVRVRSHRQQPHVVQLTFQRAAATSSSSSLSSPPASGQQQQPIASQVNGAKHGNTLYAPSEDRNSDAFRVRTTHDHALKLWGNKAAADDTDDARSQASQTTSAKALLQNSTERAAEFLWDLFLPKDAKTSVSKDYFPYAQWYFVGSIASAASGVLSMQSLLYAIGLGAGSIPTAAAVNWVLKDGLGQFGGVMFASLVNNRYDADPKRWRTASAVALDVAVLMEILTPLVPAYFLPMASLANVAKNISWLSASATRAGFHNSFAMKENLADITAKAGSQSIASSIFGTGLGIGLSTLTGASTVNVLAAFGVLSAVHIFSIYKSLACISLRTLNCQRLDLVARHFIDNNGSQVPDLETVSEQEQFMPLLVSGYKSLYTKSFVNTEASLSELSGSSSKELLRLKGFYADDKYLLNLAVPVGGAARVDLALRDDVGSRDALFAHLHAALVQKALETSSVGANAEVTSDSWEVVEKTYGESLRLRGAFVEQLEKSEWHTENLLVEEQNSRFKWLE
ncbi:putative mitochondrial protein [Globisporangium polare]